MYRQSTTILTFTKWKVPQPRRPPLTSLNTYCLSHHWLQLGSIRRIPDSPCHCRPHPTSHSQGSLCQGIQSHPHLGECPAPSWSHLVGWFTHGWRHCAHCHICRDHPHLGSHTQ